MKHRRAPEQPYCHHHLQPLTTTVALFKSSPSIVQLTHEGEEPPSFIACVTGQKQTLSPLMTAKSITVSATLECHEGVDFSGGSSLQSGLWGLRRVATAREGASGGVSRQKAEGKGIWRWRQWGTGKTSPVILVL
ncbi:unnamed protein product [Lactuca saligna]|uniref:Uncharacterized protein n=1 Tax=Lactuca saligna TaxID=75948 RepID=A0AA35V432_LACSI|nr:unnamed protein product [Lactuca saligna]